jgi:hypothetical protein
MMRITAFGEGRLFHTRAGLSHAEEHAGQLLLWVMQ